MAKWNKQVASITHLFTDIYYLFQNAYKQLIILLSVIFLPAVVVMGEWSTVIADFRTAVGQSASMSLNILLKDRTHYKWTG